MAENYSCYRLGQKRSILVTRKAGEAVQGEIAAALAAAREGILYLDFTGVEIIDYSFADAAIAKTASLLAAGGREDRFLLLRQLRPEWEENIDVALKQRQVALLAGDARDWRILGTLKEHLLATLAQVIAKQETTARELGKENGLNLGAANNRLAELWRLRLVRRREEILPGGGRQFRYSSLLPPPINEGGRTVDRKEKGAGDGSVPN